LSTVSLDDLPVPEILDARTVSLDVHRHLRQLIIDNVIPAGTVLMQAHLARVFGVSRTPMREAFRMLQEEGLIATEANQRAVVRELDPEELDQLYGVRIALESLGAQLTAGRLTAAELSAASAALAEMARTRIDSDAAAWLIAHRRFHLLCVARAGEPLTRVIQSYGERSERYLRAHQLAHPLAFRAAHAEHEAILEAIREGDADRAGTLMAEHLSHTSFTVLGDVGRDGNAPATRIALAMARGIAAV
jgi:DNA-binding GntR family transcriptional regulator